MNNVEINDVVTIVGDGINKYTVIDKFSNGAFMARSHGGLEYNLCASDVTSVGGSSSQFKTVESHCDCVEHYIHAKANTLYCAECDTHEHDRPDSRELEVQEGSQLRHPLSY